MDKNIRKVDPVIFYCILNIMEILKMAQEKFKKVLKEVRFLSIFFKVTKTLDEKIFAFHKAVKNLHLAIVKS